MTGFADQVAKFSAEAMEKIDAVVAETVRELGREVIKFTHVKSGTLIANYNYSAEAPDTRVTKATANHTTAKINNLEDIPRQASGHIHYITNAVPYAGFAEFGTSKMAPHRMLGLTAQGFQGTVDRVVARLAK